MSTKARFYKNVSSGRDTLLKLAIILFHRA